MNNINGLIKNRLINTSAVSNAPIRAAHTFTSYCQIISLALMLCCLAPFTFAEDEETEGDGSESAGGTIYFSIDPAFVTNYGGTDRLRYVKVEVTLKVDGEAGLSQINHHMPVIRDEMLSLFAQQTASSINSIEGKEELRAKSLEKISEAMLAEDDENHVLEVLFTNFVAHSL